MPEHARPRPDTSGRTGSGADLADHRDRSDADLRPVVAELGHAAMAAPGGEAALVSLPSGVLAAVVTWLEMAHAPPPRPDPPGTGDLRLVRWPAPDPAAYRSLHRAVGQDWLWFSRLRLGDRALATLLSDPGVETYRAIGADGTAIGLLELDFREMPAAAELAFFGLAPAALGRGAGRWLMNRALETVWRRRPAPGRLTVHTCTLDHPAALDFYRRSGFRPVARAVELTRDPRLDGTLPADAAPGIPLL